MKAQYKCRLCGKIFSQYCCSFRTAIEVAMANNIYPDKKEREKYLRNLNLRGFVFDPGVPIMHDCGPKMIGIADFVGFIPEEEDMNANSI